MLLTSSRYPFIGLSRRELPLLAPQGNAQFGMASVYGTERGFTVAEISVFVALIYVGGLITQYPIGWLSDRMDRRKLIFGMAGLGVAAGAQGETTATPAAHELAASTALAEPRLRRAEKAGGWEPERKSA